MTSPTTSYMRPLPAVVALVAALLAAFVLVLMASNNPAHAIPPRDVDPEQGLPGQETGIFIDEGDRVRITARGTVDLNTTNPTLVTPDGVGNADTNFVLSGAKKGALLGSIGAFSETNGGFVIGSGTSFTAPVSGELYLIVNDCLSCFGDNAGSFTAHIKVKPSNK